MPLSLADVLSAQAGGGPVYEGGPDANVTLGSVLSALGMGGPSWLDAAGKQTGADIAAYQRGGVPEMMADTGQTQELAGGFGGTTTGKGIRAYHGSPYDFEKFDISKIGTGEGAQSYGHGLYFAENPEVAGAYKRDLVARNDAGRQHVQSLLDRGEIDPETARKAFEAWGAPKGKMYEVNINAEPGQFLNWDKPLSEQPHLKSLVDAKLAELQGSRGPLADPANSLTPEAYLQTGAMSGDPFYRLLGSKKEASKALSEAGIPGIRYLDQGSRAYSGDVERALQYLPTVEKRLAADPTNARLQEIHAATLAAISQTPKPTSNYVVFNPDIVDILKKYGLAGLTMGGVLTAAGQEPAPSQ